MNAYKAIEKLEECKELTKKLVALEKKLYDSKDISEELEKVGVTKTDIEDIRVIVSSYRAVIEKQLKCTEINI